MYWWVKPQATVMGRCLKTFIPERCIGTRTHDSENQLSIPLCIFDGYTFTSNKSCRRKVGLESGCKRIMSMISEVHDSFGNVCLATCHQLANQDVFYVKLCWIHHTRSIKLAPVHSGFPQRPLISLDVCD
jgi:hypothetical protein